MLFEKDPEKIICKFTELFPVTDLPKTGHQNKNYNFFSTDIPQNQNAVFNYEISYKFNNYGYRCDAFHRKDKNVMTLGCSIGFGNGIPVDKRFSSVFCQCLGKEVNDWNLSWPGVSGDYVSRMAVTCIPILKPDILLINFPNLSRREFFDIKGNIYAHRPNRKTYSSVEQELHSSFMNLTSDNQDLYRLYMHYKIIESTCLLYDVKFLYSVHDSDYQKFLKLNLNKDRFVKCLKKIDFARDGGHPGILSNQKHGKNYFERLNL